MKSPALLIGFEGGKSAPGAVAEEGSGALAGSALAKALKSGDGQAIFDAFAALQRECDDAHGDDEPDVAEPPTAA